MKLNIVVSDRTVRLYGDRDFFSLLSSESTRLARSGHGQYCEFQTAELHQPEDGQIQYRVFTATDLMDVSSYKELSPEGFDTVFMVIEDADFLRYP